MQTLICLVRHGATDWNFDGRAQGRADIPLNAEGVRQAEAVAARLAAETWTAIYSSPSSRAFHTAETIARRAGLPAPQTDHRLMERDVGPVEGTTIPERRQRWPEITDWRTMPGIESDADVGVRAGTVLTELAKRHLGGRIICVTHGGVISSFLKTLLSGESAPTFLYSRNTSISRVLFENGVFSQEGGTDHSHILVDGIEYTGEKLRAMHPTVAHLPGMALPRTSLEPLVFEAMGVETAWAGERPVGFARLCPRGTVDVIACAPEHAHLEPILVERLKNRLART